MKRRTKVFILIGAVLVLMLAAGLFVLLAKPSAKIVSVKVEPLEKDLTGSVWAVWAAADGRYEQKLWKGSKPEGTDYVKVTFTVRMTNPSLRHWYADKALIGDYDSSNNFFISEWSDPTPHQLGRISREEYEFTALAFRNGRSDAELSDIIRGCTLGIGFRKDSEFTETLSLKDAELIF